MGRATRLGRYTEACEKRGYSVCALDCPDTCSLLIDIEDGKGNKLRGNPQHPVTRGFLCGKVARYLDREYSPDRLLYPQRRVGEKGEGRFERISWDNALDEVARGLQKAASEAGSESILPYSYAGTMGLLQGNGMDRRFFHRLGASRLDRTICSMAGTVGMLKALGARYGTEPEQFRESKLIIAWGANVLSTNVHLWPFIVEARRRGAKFYVIDPIRTKTAGLADTHFAPHPGSDQALAFGLMHVIIRDGLVDSDYVSSYTSGFEKLRQQVLPYTPDCVEELTGIDAAAVETLAREYATTLPCRYPGELRSAALGAWWGGGAGHFPAPGSDRLVSPRWWWHTTLNLTSVSAEPRGFGDAGAAVPLRTGS